MGDHGEVGIGHMEDGVSCVLVIVKRCMEGWRVRWTGLGCEEEDWLAGLAAQVGPEPACTLLPRIIAGRVAVVFLALLWVRERMVLHGLIRESMGQKEGSDSGNGDNALGMPLGFIFENSAALREV